MSTGTCVNYFTHSKFFRACSHPSIAAKTDQARTDWPRSEFELEVIQKQLARLPTRRELAGTGRGIGFATMMLTTLSLLVFLR